MDTLTEAGYEAYNVTADNYDTLEAELQTDFAGMGLNPEGSYIIVVHGDEPTAANSNARTGGDDIIIDPGDPGSGSGIQHTYEGITYTMRSVAIASNTDSDLHFSKSYVLLDEKDTSEYISEFLSFLSSWGIDALCYSLPVSGSYELWSNWSNTEEYSVLDQTAPSLITATSWNLRYTQVWDDQLNRWITTQCSSYAETNARVTGYVYNSNKGETGGYDVIDSGNKSATLYSYYYNRYDRYDLAAKGYVEGVIYRDYTDVGFYFFNNNDVSFNADGSPSFVHEETTRALYPAYTEN